MSILFTTVTKIKSNRINERIPYYLDFITDNILDPNEARHVNQHTPGRCPLPPKISNHIRNKEA